MAFSRPWKSLNISGEHPLLLLKADMNQTQCTLELTDLNRVWAISLTRNELVESARQQRASIDPGEDDEQFCQFLSKMQSAFNREGKTRLRLEPGEAEDGLELSVAVPLPGSLPTFKWKMQLQRLDSDDSNALEADLVAPLLLYTNTLRSQIQHLVEQLGHKDRVIAKIADKLENIGQDLTQVFPGASHIKFHKRTPKRAQLASHVDGLAPFDAALWQAGSAKGGTNSEPSVEALDDLLAGLPASRLLTAHEDMKSSWWRSCGGGNVLSDASDQTEDDSMVTDGRTEYGRTDGRAKSPPTLRHDGSSKFDGDFQRQATPPQRVSTPPATGDDDEEETEDEYDLDAPRPKVSQQQVESQTSGEPPMTDHVNAASNSGTMNEDAERYSTRRTSEPQAKAGLGAFGGKHQARTPEPEREDSPPSPSERDDRDGPKLGKFGGQRKRKTPDPDVDEGPSDSLQSPPKRTNKLGAFGGGSSRPTNTSPAKTKSSLGAFSGRAKAEPDNEEEEDDLDAPRCRTVAQKTSQEEERQSRAPKKVEAEAIEQKRENSEEWANDRRDKLKQNIAERKKEPVKKKRKF
ncbi:hypothetical protein BST61_g7713 [Cercospora zeina]